MKNGSQLVLWELDAQSLVGRVITVDAWQAFFLPTAAGAAVGVVAGVLVNYLFYVATDLLRMRRQKYALRLEYQYNRRVLDDAKKNLEMIRDLLARQQYLLIQPYFPLERAIHVQLNKLINDGTLYDLFTEQELPRVQRIYTELTTNTAIWYQNEISKRRDHVMQNPSAENVGDLAGFVDYVRLKFDTNFADLDALIAKFR